MEELKLWLQSFPLWEGGEPETDRLQHLPGSCGLFPQGTEKTTLREDVLGNRGYTCRQKFLLRRLAVAGSEAARWLTEFQNWVAEQSQGGLAPALEQGQTLWSAQAGRLIKTDPGGLGTYEVVLTACYEEGDLL